MSTYGKRGIVVRLIYLIGAMLWYIFSFGGQLGRKGIVVLCYHGISSADRNKFKWQMSHISCKSVETADLAKIEKPQSIMQPKVYITFDDAFENFLDNALPSLEQYGIPAIVFAVAGNLGNKPRWQLPEGNPDSEQNIMTDTQLSDLSEHSLIKIGSHTLTHFDLVTIPSDQILTELVDSKEQLEDMLKCTVDEIAFPHGSYNEQVLGLAQEAGYKRFYTLDPKPVCPASGSPVIGRFTMSPDVWKIEFILTCAGSYAWLCLWRKAVRALKGKLFSENN